MLFNCYSELEFFILQPALPPPPVGFPTLDFSLEQHQQRRLMNPPPIGAASTNDNNDGAVNYMTIGVSQQQQQQQQQQQLQQNQHHITSGLHFNNSLDRLSFADVMQFADFGPKLALNQGKNIVAQDEEEEEEAGIDPSGYFLKFPVLHDKLDEQTLAAPSQNEVESNNSSKREVEREDHEKHRISDNTTPLPPQIQFIGENSDQKNLGNPEGKNKRKRPRSIKTSEEVESQRMTHIAVERNRRKQMNEHLRVLRSLMPGSYVQRGDQASIIGGAIEFVRELEQLLQCLESQKRRRLSGGGEGSHQVGDSSSLALCQQPPQPPQSPFFPPLVPLSNEEAAMEFGMGDGAALREDMAESKSCLADVEVKLLGFDAMIKILSRRRPGQLIRTIAALEDLQLNILHTNITTIEQTVLYSFNVKTPSESRYSADDIASSVQQIFSFIHANSGI